MPSVYIGQRREKQLTLCRMFFQQVQPQKIQDITNAIFTGTNMDIYFERMITRSMRFRRSCVCSLLAELMQEFPIFAQYVTLKRALLADCDTTTSTATTTKRITVKTLGTPRKAHLLLKSAKNAKKIKRHAPSFGVRTPCRRYTDPSKSFSIPCVVDIEKEENIYVGLEEYLHAEDVRLQVEIASLEQALRYAHERFQTPFENIHTKFFFSI